MAVDGGHKTLVVIGGGAAGYFGAIQAASSSTSGLNVIVLEAAKLPLQKVKISGGGRCNVMHDSAKAVSLIAKGYPRGSKQLIGPFKSLFGPEDAAAWFGSRGVTLKTEGDGRMFPVTDDSQTIIDCLEEAARKASVEVVTSARVTSVLKRRAEPAEAGNATDGADGVEAQPQQQPPRFELEFATATPLPPAVRKALGVSAAGIATAGERSGAAAAHNNGAASSDSSSSSRSSSSNFSSRRSTSTRGSYRIACDYVLQATGAAREGHGWAKKLGHAVSPPVPSLFTLTIRDPRLEGLSGLSVQDAELKLFADEKHESSSAAKAGKPAGSRVSGEGEGGVGEDDARPGGAEAAAVAAGNGESAGGGKKKKKRKRGKQQAAVTQRGPLLITHAGVSGPAALKLSAFGARVLNESGYRGRLVVNWMAGNNPSKTLDELQAFRTRNAKKTVYAFCPVVGSGAPGSSVGSGGRPQSPQPPSISSLPRRLWQSLALAAGVAAGDKWADLSKAKLSALAQQLTACEFQIVGKGSFKEEFVTCGGVALSALDMRTMESKTVAGLHFAGEVVDVDGVTGGFNFQSAWTTGWVAGSAIGSAASVEGTTTTPQWRKAEIP
ncbi:unnamed protein product [Ectocarpus sp. 4 AP-2014]